MAVAGVVLLVTSACGGGDESASFDSDASTASSRATADETDEMIDASEEAQTEDVEGDEDEADGPLLPTSGDDEAAEGSGGEDSGEDGMGDADTGDSGAGDSGASAVADAAPDTSGEPPDDLPTTAAELTAALDEAELALRAPGVTEATALPWGHRQQYLYQVLFDNPGWADEVLAAVDPSIADAVGHNWVARQNLSALVNSHGISDVLPAWRIVAPAPADELLGYYRDAGEATGVPWEVLASINLIETRMGRIRGISSAGAVGPMQFLPTTWAECCEGDPTKDSDAIRGAAEYLIDRGGATELDRAIFGYNNSDRYVAAVQAYAAVLMDDPDAYYGYHSWQVFFLSADGLLVLPVGYEELEPVDAGEWLAENPQALYES